MAVTAIFVRTITRHLWCVITITVMAPARWLGALLDWRWVP